jgi:D-3-phosphoglycerate dehydrogenase / 2-oxoglutarate reductase
LFIKDEHVRQLEEAGYEVERLPKPDASEDELIEGLKGKTAYILGGIEKVTDRVLESTDELKVISFTGADWKALITGWETANKKGIAISNAPGGNSFAVAEFCLAMALAMQRNLFEIGRTGDKSFATTLTLKDTTVGVIGAGRIGTKIISETAAFGPSKILYYSRSQKDCGAEYVELDELLSSSDIIFVAAPGTSGELLNAEAQKKIKNGALIVSISPKNLIDFDALYEHLENGDFRAAVDWPIPDEKYNSLPLSVWFNTNSHNAYNTEQAAKLCSDMAVQSLLNLLSTGDDQYLVNPEYKNSAV